MVPVSKYHSVYDQFKFCLKDDATQFDVFVSKFFLQLVFHFKISICINYFWILSRDNRCFVVEAFNIFFKRREKFIILCDAFLNCAV